MQTELPPVPGIETEIKLVPASMREDAVQEAWVAHLEGGDAIAAVSRFVKREKRFAARHLQIEQDESGNECGVTKRGKLIPLSDISAPRQSNLRSVKRA